MTTNDKGLLVQNTPFFHCKDQPPRRPETRCDDDATRESLDLVDSIDDRVRANSDIVVRIIMTMAEILRLGLNLILRSGTLVCNVTAGSPSGIDWRANWGERAPGEWRNPLSAANPQSF